GAKGKIDFLGAALLSVASVLFLLAMVWAGDKYSWASLQIVGLLAGAVVFTGIFINQERRHPEPILPLNLFRNQVFLLSNVVVFTFGLGVFALIQYIGIFVQTALGASATASGIVTTPQSAGVLITSILGGQLMARTGKYKAQTFVGTLIIASALALMLTVSPGMPKWQLGAYMVVLGLGFGLVLPSMSLIVQNAVAPRYIGVASSSNQFFRQIGAVMGIAVFGVILAHTYRTEVEARIPADDLAAIEAVSPNFLAELDDPTLRLNKAYWQPIVKDVSALEGGPEILARAEDAQNDAMTAAMKIIFLVALGAAALTAFFVFIMKEIPLRRHTPGTQPGGAPAAAGQGVGRPPIPGQEPGGGGGS
ncbi:MAG: MFS transporter, partial [Dehalococcoidia bacterium]|nr:MFS transporter [Dehalococcoidia bacterium]